MTKSARTFLAVGVLVLPVWLLGASGCSDSSSGPSGDASTADATADVEAGPPPALGVPVPSCAGCPVCGGVLASATTGFTYCTQNCATNADCPTGTACATTVLSTGLSGQCLQSCTANADCQGGFICRTDLPSPGAFCWSPYPPPVVDAGQDAASDANAGDAGTADTGAPDASLDASPDGEASDAAVSDVSDAAPDGP